MVVIEYLVYFDARLLFAALRLHFILTSSSMLTLSTLIFI